ncbi:MAG: hypothetical protein ACYTE8_04980 [Planctomycetota bacterium]|jgi:hypothetical protein
MKIRISRHIFGSIKGYKSLAKSEDLSHQEISELEILSFGQTNEETYLNSLQANPAYISRPLQSGRWAVTRVFQGERDVHNRTTLLFVSAIFKIEDWLYLIKCDIDKLLYCPILWKWESEEKLQSIEVSFKDTRQVSGIEIRDKVLSLLAVIEKYAHEENTTIITMADEFDVKVIRLLNMVLPITSKKELTIVARSLNDGMPIKLISMAQEGSLGNSKRKTVMWHLTSIAEDVPYTEALTEFWRAESQPPWRFIDSCDSFGIDLESEPLHTLPESTESKEKLISIFKEPKEKQALGINRKLVVSFIATVLVILFTFATIKMIQNKAKEEKLTSLLGEIRTFLEMNALEKELSTNQLSDAIAKGRDLKYRIEIPIEGEKNTEIRNIKSDVTEWLNSAHNLLDRHLLLEIYFRQFRILNIKESLNVYPKPVVINDVNALESGLYNIDKTALGKSYISQITDVNEKIIRWRKATTEIIYNKKEETRDFIQSCTLSLRPQTYSEQEHNKYNKILLKLQNNQKEENVLNALSSSNFNDKNIATEIISDINRAITDCNIIMSDLKNIKEESLRIFFDANDILSDPNIGNGNIENFDRLKKAYDGLQQSYKLWPKIPMLENKKKESEEKYATNKDSFNTQLSGRLLSVLDVNEPNNVEKYLNDPNVIEGIKNNPQKKALVIEYFKIIGELKKANINNNNEILPQVKKYDENLQIYFNSKTKEEVQENKNSK